MSTRPTFVARQPILDAHRRVFGYELLFRDSLESETSGGGSDAASASVITNAVLGLGLDTLTRGRAAFVNVTRTLLVDGLPEVLPPGRVVLELTEDIDPDPDVLEACSRLRQAGYRLALDDFVLTERTATLIPLASFIKVDFLATSAEMRAEIKIRCARHAPVLLAEKIETVEAFDEASREGFRYFQGFFFGRPTVRTGGTIPGHQLHSLRIITALQNPNLSAQQLEDVIKVDVRLCYLILRSANSAAFARQSKVRSIRDALVLVGRNAVRRWASLWLLAGLGDSSHPELVSMAVTRAHCCESLCRSAGLSGGDGFLVGMCSLLDSILRRPMTELLAHLPLDEDAQAALLGQDNAIRRVLDSVIAYERADWAAFGRRAADAGVTPEELGRCYHEALRATLPPPRAAA